MDEILQHQQSFDSDSGTPQRKRIAVACGRCRKRKIRCSGDPGHNQPCSNCRNAGAEPCVFLRVASRETPFRADLGDFPFGGVDARLHASRSMAFHPHELASQPLGPDILPSYRGGYPSQPYTPATKAYYPAMSPFQTAYNEEYDYSSYPTVPSQSVMSADPVQVNVGMPMPPAWPTTAAARTAKSGGYTHHLYSMEPETSTYSAYTSTALVHRPAQTGMSSDTPSFSFSNVAASLPTSPPPGRHLPTPIITPLTRSSTVPYPSTINTNKHITPTTSMSLSSTSSSLSEIASTPSYTTTGYDVVSSPISYSPPSSRPAISDTYANSSQPEQIFSDSTRDNLTSNGPGYDQSGAIYSSETRRDSHSGGGGSGSGNHSTATYAPAESAHEATHHDHVTPHPHPHQHHAHASHSHASSHHHHHHHSVNDTATSTSSGGGTSHHGGHGHGHLHAESRQVAVSTRH
ncbi:hypothetical protein QBC38DRAFT_446236 [Podospora fimiseda]|uniref:Zn(2)-C6 fungal-type domain-containing protein n=1 Tax=Podospora fimiseda TaxID=252190 RepID=A0AAN7BJY7_9PEZI|nr:hypothetical protein QBC38DRAFT_446236 [Podospora fimiseda]